VFRDNKERRENIRNEILCDGRILLQPEPLDQRYCGVGCADLGAVGEIDEAVAAFLGVRLEALGDRVQGGGREAAAAPFP
jgi:hypothetical protein